MAVELDIRHPRLVLARPPEVLTLQIAELSPMPVMRVDLLGVSRGTDSVERAIEIAAAEAPRGDSCVTRLDDGESGPER